MSDISQIKQCIQSLKVCDLSKKLVKDYTFTNLSKKIRDKKFIDNFNTYFSQLFSFTNTFDKHQITIKETRIFLTSFVIYSFPDIVLQNPNLENLTKKIILLNRKLLNSYENVISISEISNIDYLIKNINIFFYNFFNFIGIFNIWKTKDEKDLLNDFIRIYLELESNEVNLDKYPEDYQKTFKENVVKEKSDIKKKIFMISGNRGIKYLDDTISEFKKFQEDIIKIYEDTTKIVKSAFWDSLEEKINCEKPDFNVILPILEEMMKMFYMCVPKRMDIHYEINEFIDLPLLKQMIDNDAIYITDVTRIIDYSFKKLEKLQPASKDKETKEFNSTILNEFESDQNLGKLLTKFFPFMFENIEEIIISKHEFEQTELYQKIKENKIDLRK